MWWHCSAGDSSGQGPDVEFWLDMEDVLPVGPLGNTEDFAVDEFFFEIIQCTARRNSQPQAPGLPVCYLDVTMLLMTTTVNKAQLVAHLEKLPYIRVTATGRE